MNLYLNLLEVNQKVSSNKTVNYCYKDLKSTIPTFKNNNNSDIVDIYCKITSTIKKRDD